MKCPRCAAQNQEDAQFCEDCGARLELSCPSCGRPVTSGKKFCRSCGAAIPPEAAASPSSYTPKHLAERILTSKSALEGERKQVTVLFADLKGSMELLADRDPEEARTILDPVLQLMMDAVHRYEGTVNQVMGDGIMALFGAPIAHEDHAVRACYAALRMQEAVRHYAEQVFRRFGVQIQIRVGLNSGDVVVRAIGSDLRMDYTAVGQSTHLAARMEQMAQPGTILLTPETVALAEGFVQVASRGPVPVKGLVEPIELFELTGASPVQSRLHAAASRGLTRFVGRAAEIDLLQQALGKAGEGHGQLVAVVGEPGVGKSRLIWEFTHSHRTDGWLVLEAASASYGKATTYFPVIGLLRNYFRIEPRDDGRKVHEKIIGKLLSLDRALEPTLPVFLSLLDVSVEDAEWAKLDPSQRRRQTLEALKRLMVRESQVQPVLLLVEDLHWIDGETQAWLDVLVESLPTVRVLLLTNYRPEYKHGWGSKTYYQQVRLDMLTAAHAGELLKALLGTGPGLEDLERLLIERTQGNPFFLEESVRALVETRMLMGERGEYQLARPIQRLQLPATAQAILAARIDRLAAEDKRLLQAAAVVGKDVPFALLQAIAEEPDELVRRSLTRLQAAEFLYEARLFPELEYTFKHALTHEVTYVGVLQERRSALHARIYDTMEQLHEGHLDEHVERLAHHALRGELWERALHYLRQAAGKAAARSALHEARTWLEQALEVVDKLRDGRAALEQAFEIRLELRPVLSLLGETRRTLEHLREAEALAERLNDDRRRGRVYAFMSNTQQQFDELDDALTSGARALAIARSLRDVDLQILSTTYLVDTHYFRGDYEPAVELAIENLAALPANRIYERFGNASPVSVYVGSFLARSLAELGRFDEAARYAAETVSIAEQTGHAFTVGLACSAARTVHFLKGDWVRARPVSEHGTDVVRAGNVLLLLPALVAASAVVLAQLGEREEALNRLWEGEQFLKRPVINRRNLGLVCSMLSRAWLLLDRLDQAATLGARAVECCERQPGFEAHALHLLGDIATHPDRFDPDSGEAHYRQALALAEPRGMKPLVAHCHLGIGTLYRRTGKSSEAAEHITAAATLYRDMDMRFYLERAEAEMRLTG